MPKAWQPKRGWFRCPAAFFPSWTYLFRNLTVGCARVGDFCAALWTGSCCANSYLTHRRKPTSNNVCNSFFSCFSAPPSTHIRYSALYWRKVVPLWHSEASSTCVFSTGLCAFDLKTTSTSVKHHTKCCTTSWFQFVKHIHCALVLTSVVICATGTETEEASTD